MLYVRMTRALVAAALGLFVPLLSACDDEVTSPPADQEADPIVALRVEPGTVRLPVDSSLLIGAEFVHESGSVSEAVNVVWLSLKPAVAVVDSSGRVKAIGSGRVRIVAAAEGLSAVAVVDVPGWFSVLPLPAPRRRGHAGVLGGKLYYTSGADSWGEDHVATTFVFDPETESWTTAPSIPTPRDDGAVATAGDYLYVIGGISPDAPHNGYNRLWVNEAFRASDQSWVARRDMPTARGGVRAETVGGKIYVIGGRTGVEFLATVEVYDPATDTWSTGPSLPAACESPGIGLLGDEIYVAGGLEADHGTTSALKIFDPAQGTWRTGLSMPTARAFVASAVLQGRLVILGGWPVYPAQIPLATVEAYDPETESWSRLPPMPVPRREASAAVLEGILYVIGGGTDVALTDRVDGYIP
jgi:N-acetylneuraminic acid mutarotase